MELKNRLAAATSPYLQQHKDNPVHWQPWNMATLDLARKLDRPILLSVGYSACHWCHVMAHECFEDHEVADLMNAFFVNIKVDREERPDIDQIYMAALAAAGEQGGWPLTMFLTPDAHPIWGGTYFPKTSRYGRPGFTDVLRSVHHAWKNRRSELVNGAGGLKTHIERQLAGSAAGSITPPADFLRRIATSIHSLIDPVHGGISGAPKFPNAPLMHVLWLSALESGDRSLAESVADSLSKMLCGGIYDHIGGGLCRYSTDEKWIVPHFEKMLYDNAQLLQLLTYIHPSCNEGLFRSRIEDQVTWMQREMAVESGAFASSLDADSEGEEGRYYLWDRFEVESILEDRADAFFRHYSLAAPPGWHGKPVLIRERRDDPDPPEIRDCLTRLRIHRAGRVAPGRDDKVLTDWNGLAIRAIADASRLLERQDWQDIARNAFNAISAHAAADGRLPHSVNGSRRLFPAMSSDYAAMINAAISLHQALPDPDLIDLAQRWAAILREDHGDGDHGYFLTSATADDVPIRIRGDADEAIPSATAQIIEALVRLASATADLNLLEHAQKSARKVLARVAGQQHGTISIYAAASLAESPSKLIIVDHPNDRPLARIAAQFPDPRRVDLALTTGDEPDRNPLPVGSRFDTSQPGAWLCTGQTCLPPAHDTKTLATMLATPFRSLRGKV